MKGVRSFYLITYTFKNLIILILSIVICMPVFQACNFIKEEKAKKKQLDYQLAEEERQKIEIDKRRRDLKEQDSIAKKELSLKYNAFSNIDTLDDIYTFKVKEIIKKYSNIIGIEGEILDIDTINSQNVILVDLFGFSGFGKFLCDSIVFNGIINKTNFLMDFDYGYFIVKISDVKPLFLEVAADSDENVRIKSPSYPFRLFYGEIIDSYLQN